MHFIQFRVLLRYHIIWWWDIIKLLCFSRRILYGGLYVAMSVVQNNKNSLSVVFLLLWHTIYLWWWWLLWFFLWFFFAKERQSLCAKRRSGRWFMPKGWKDVKGKTVFIQITSHKLITNIIILIKEEIWGNCDCLFPSEENLFGMNPWLKRLELHFYCCKEWQGTIQRQRCNELRSWSVNVAFSNGVHVGFLHTEAYL